MGTKISTTTRYFAKRTAIIILLIFVISSLQAQQLKGVTMDMQTNNVLPGVMISNIQTGDGSYSQTDGSYTIDASEGDSIIFSRLGYKAGSIKLKAGNNYINIKLVPQTFELEEITINKQLTPYQRDSLERRSVFGKKADQKPAKVAVVVVPLGIAVNGGVTALAEKISRKYRRLKKFQKRYKKVEKELFAATRYTTGLVKSLTALVEPQLTDFIQQYPVEPDFALAATDIELNMWILYNYRQWQKKLNSQADDNK